VGRVGMAGVVGLKGAWDGKVEGCNLQEDD
jgi:hypothetical protein